MVPSPQISVVIPTYRRPDLLLECVASLLHDSSADYEILVVDQDPERCLQAKIAEKFENDPRIRYLFHDQTGASRARNAGVKQARGEIIAFLDDDLEVVPGWLRAYVDAFAAIRPSPGMVGGRVAPLWLAPKPDWLPKESEYLLGIYDKGGKLGPMAEDDLPFTANCAIQLSTFYEVGMLDERIGFSYARKSSMLAGEDSLLALKVRQASYSIYYQPHARAQHKISSNKLTKKYFLKRHFWEGVTTVVVLHLSESALLASFPGVIRWHIGAVVYRLWRAIFPAEKSQGGLRQTEGRMRLAGGCAYSLGAIYAGIKLWWTGRLP